MATKKTKEKKIRVMVMKKWWQGEGIWDFYGYSRLGSKWNQQELFVSNILLRYYAFLEFGRNIDKLKFSFVEQLLDLYAASSKSNMWIVMMLLVQHGTWNVKPWIPSLIQYNWIRVKVQIYELSSNTAPAQELYCKRK